MRVIEQKIGLDELKKLAEERFGDMVKAVVDVARGIMVVGGELHSDQEALLLDRGSRQADLWGINIYPDEPPTSWIEFDSMINVRPSQGNRSRGIENQSTQAAIRRVTATLVTDT